jgi:LacI family transcriptional regulator
MGDEGAARLATEHLAGLGHRRIGFIAGSDEYELSAWRTEGWRAAMKAARLDTDGLLIEGDFSYASGRAAAIALLEQEHPATGIVACNDQMALATLEVARERRLRVPADLSLISFDNTPIVHFTHPPLTAIRQPIAEVTARAVELIIAELAGQALPEAPVVVPATLMLRSSTASPRA